MWIYSHCYKTVIFSVDLFIKYNIVIKRMLCRIYTIKRLNFPLFYCHVIIKFCSVNNSIISAKNLFMKYYNEKWNRDSNNTVYQSKYFIAWDDFLMIMQLTLVRPQFRAYFFLIRFPYLAASSMPKYIFKHE